MTSASIDWARLGLDTSVTLRLLTGVPEDQAEAARLLVATAAQPIAVSDLVVSETYFALRHHYAVPQAEAVAAIAALLDDPRIRGAGSARAVLRALPLDGGTAPRPGLIDRLIHADYGRDDVALATLDRDLGRLEGVRLMTGNSAG